jgi:hypothetical protein
VSKFADKFQKDFYFEEDEDSENFFLEKRMRRDISPKKEKIRKNEEMLKQLRREDMKYGEK